MYWFGTPIQFGNTFQRQSQELFLPALKTKVVTVRYMRTLREISLNLAYLSFKKILVGRGDELLVRRLKLIFGIIQQV
jgi:hypothetical protein